MDKNIYVAEQTLDNGKVTISIKKQITQEELDKLNSSFLISPLYHLITQIKDIVLQNGIDFQKYMNPDNLQLLRENNVSSDELIMNANKLSLNYATSIKTYIDMETRILKKDKSNEDYNKFHSLCSNFYDTHFEYRFWSNFRNYVVHCEFPYCKYVETFERSCKVICTKEHLLDFDNWKHSRQDIIKMDEEIDLPAMVNVMSGLINALYINFFVFFKDLIINGISIYGDFCRKYSVESPTIVKAESPMDLQVCNIQPLPVEELVAAFNALKSNPNIHINIL